MGSVGVVAHNRAGLSSSCVVAGSCSGWRCTESQPRAHTQTACIRSITQRPFDDEVLAEVTVVDGGIGQRAAQSIVCCLSGERNGSVTSVGFERRTRRTRGEAARAEVVVIDRKPCGSKQSAANLPVKWGV